MSLQDLVYAFYERRLARRLGPANRLHHVAVIMGGTGAGRLSQRVTPSSDNGKR